MRGWGCGPSPHLIGPGDPRMLEFENLWTGNSMSKLLAGGQLAQDVQGANTGLSTYWHLAAIPAVTVRVKPLWDSVAEAAEVGPYSLYLHLHLL